ncbi:leucine-rich repeat-containing G-protein coupled receptor 6 [Megaptera novaeangliae]
MPSAPGLRALWLCAALCASLCAPQPGPRPACPAPCRCHEDGIMLSADCSERGLSAVPGDLDPLTAYLDLSMNNLTELRPGLFLNLRFLEELRLSGNRLSHIPGQAFSGLYSLKILMLQNNLLGGIPAEALWELRSLQSLRLDANLISLVPDRSFEGLSSLRHLWLDDNALSEIPVRALGNLRALQAVTLALNRIGHIPDHAFRNLSSLVVLHLHNNHIQHLGTHSFEGLHNLETLDLNYNQLHEFPVAIRTLGRLQELGFHNNNIKAIPEKAFLGNPLLQTIHFYDNPIQFVGRSAFRYLPRLHTLSLNGATDIQGFPDLKGTTSLEILTLTRVGLRRLPPGMCQQLPRLRVLELSHNQIEGLPSLHGCQKLEEIGLQHNRIWEIRADTFRQLTSLQALDLSWNAIRSIHPEAFVTLRSLVKLDLTDNQLTTLPLAGLGGLVHLKLKGNWALSQAFPKDSFPKLRTLEVPYAYQCCSYGVCARFFQALGRRAPHGPHPDDRDAPKTPLGLLAGPAESRYDVDPDELQLEMEDPRPHPTVQCSPVPGPFKPCEHLFESWGVRLAVWAVVLLSVLCNGLVLLSLSAAGPGPLPPVKFVVGAIAGANTLTGLSCGLLASVDALTFGRFAEYGARWESGPGCRATGFLAVLGSEASVLLLTLAAVHCSVAVACVRARGKAPAPGSLRAGALGCLVLAGLAAALPLASVGEYGASPLCLPYAPPDSRPATLGFAVALVMLNAICFLAVAAAYVRLSCDLPRAELEAVWDCAAVRHVACLTFADGLLYCPVAFLSLVSALGLFPVTPEAVKSVLLLVLPLPACLNPLLYLLFSPHFREDLRRLRPCPGAPGPLALAAAGQLEPSSCDSTQALVAFSDVELILEASEAGRPPGLETYGFTSVTLAPCQQPGGSRPEGSHFAEPEGTRFGNRPPAVDGGQPRGAEGAVPAGGVRAGAGGFQASGSASASCL